MITLLLEPGDLYYDLELQELAKIKPRPAFLPVLRLMLGLRRIKIPAGRLSRPAGDSETGGHRGSYRQLFGCFVRSCASVA
jgi:hypothetical protein